jgi:CrcB protein
MLKNYILVFIGGGLGACARYNLSGIVYRWLPSNFPYGNLLVNISGCFVIGILMASLEERFFVVPELRIFLTIGILGGFTTFSSFSYETVALLRNGELYLGIVNAGVSLIGCLLATAIGMTIGKLL